MRARVSLHRASLYSFHRLPIGDLAAMIVYRHPVIGAHMNVIFGQVGRTLWAMEPYPYPGESGARSGALLVRNVDFYICASDEITLIQPALTLLSGRSAPAPEGGI